MIPSPKVDTIMLLQLLLNAFALGSFYALVALGFSFIYGATHVFNLAHGELVLVSGYLAYVLGKTLHIAFFWTLPICMLALLGVALLLHRLLTYVRSPYELNTLVVTFGVALILQSGLLVVFSANYRMLSAPLAVYQLPAAGLIVTRNQLLLISLSLLATVLVHLLLHKTFLGKAIRATIQNHEAAKLAGIEVQRMNLTAFGIGGLLIGLAGPLYARTAYLYPAGGIEATLIAIIITIFAGVNSIPGILAGGWLLGLVQSVTVYEWGSSWQEMTTALVLIVLLVTHPEGFSTARWRRLRLDRRPVPKP